jgi:CHAD domain-containing protein
MLEQEVKLAVEGSFAPDFPIGSSDVAGVEELPALDLRATYHDTSDLRLAREGVTLRCRTGEEEGARWTVKLPAGQGVADGRDELHFGGNGKHVPQAARDLLRALIRMEELRPVARLRTRRRRWLLRGAGGDELAELVDDRVSVLERGRVVERFREIEIESRGIDRAVLERIASLLTKDGVTPGEQTPKLVRALGARAEEPPEVARPRRPKANGPAGAAVQAAVAAGVRRMILNDPRTRLGEAEPLHQMRVGTRRLRSDLRTFLPLLDRAWADSLRDELKWVGSSLGAVRDLDVLLKRLRAEGDDLTPHLEPLLRDLERRREAAREVLLADLNSARYVELLERLVEAARHPALSEQAQEPSQRALPPLGRRAWRKLRDPARALTADSAAEDYHRVRVLAKRARYAAEAVAPAFPRRRRRRAERFARRAADVQDVLGELQDSVVATRTINRFAQERPQAGPLNRAAGRMLEREERARAAARAQFPRAWRRLDRRKRRSWLR